MCNSILVQYLVIHEFQLRFIIQYFPTAECFIFARLTINGYARLDFIIAAFGCCRCERRFQCFKDDAFANTFLIGYCVYDQKDFFAHLLLTPCGDISPFHH